MTTTLAPPRSGARSTSRLTHEPREDWPIAVIGGAAVEDAPLVVARRPRYAHIEARRRFWLLDAARRDAILGSDAAFLVSFLIAWVLSGVMAYFYALWTIGPV
jgi:hypothetical protein